MQGAWSCWLAAWERESRGPARHAAACLITPERPPLSHHMLLQHLHGQALFPAISLKNAELVVNFGASPFMHAPPEGFAGLAAAPAGSTAGWLEAPAAAAAAAEGGAAGLSARRPLAIILEPARYGASAQWCSSGLPACSIRLNHNKAVWSAGLVCGCSGCNGLRLACFGGAGTWRNRPTTTSPSSASTWQTLLCATSC